MTELSPAAQAVTEAIDEVRWDWGNMQEADASIIGATALRAAAYQVAPPRPVLDSCCDHFEQAIRHKILAIANELDPPNS